MSVVCFRPVALRTKVTSMNAVNGMPRVRKLLPSRSQHLAALALTELFFDIVFSLAMTSVRQEIVSSLLFCGANDAGVWQVCAWTALRLA